MHLLRYFLPMKDRIHSISTKMAIAFFLASAAPLIVGLVLINKKAFTHSVSNTQNQLDELATTRERLLREHIKNLQGTAFTISEFPSVRKLLSSIHQDRTLDDRTLVSASKDLYAIQQSTWGDTHHIFLTDTSGKVLLSPPHTGWDDLDLTPEKIWSTQSPHYGASIANADQFDNALQEPAVSGFFGFSERDHYHQLAMNPVRDADGQVVGVVVIEISIDTVQALLIDNFSLGESGHLYLMTNTGKRVVHFKKDAVPDSVISPGLTQSIKLHEVESGHFQYGENDVLGFYLPSEIYPWVVCVEMDYDEVLKPVLAQQHNFMIVGGIILGLCGFTAVFVARKFGSPIKELVKSANAVASGDFFREIEITSTDEVGQLQSAVDAMRLSLRQQIDHLDHTVIERTAELERLNTTLKHDSEHDKLTGLANRTLFCRRLDQEIRAYKDDPDHLIAVLFFDFDRFKLVNDSLGHAAGDMLLCSIADRFRASLRATDLAARFGGDEFVVLLSPAESQNHALEGADRFLKLFEEHHKLDGHEIVSTASIGIVTADPRYNSAEEMIRDADAAMYQAKLDGKGRVVRFDQEMLERSKFRLRVEEDLNKAIELDQLRVAYQPIINLESLDTTGFEALIRWEHPELGWIRPDQFIDIAEDTGQIVKIGQWVFEQAIAHIQEWNDRFETSQKLSVNINVSKRQFVDTGFMPFLRSIFKKSGINPKQVKIEITESTIVDPRSSGAMREIFDEIQAIGVPIAMDDFGTGNSSLGLLHNYKFDILKIDQSFIRDLELNRGIAAVLHAIIELAQNTGMAIVAEGVETESQVATLIDLGCDFVQGYYFSKALFPDEVVEYLSGLQDFRSVA